MRRQWRLVMGERMVADVRAQVALSLFTDFDNFNAFKPAAMHSRPWGTSRNQPGRLAEGTTAANRPPTGVG